MTPGQVGQLFDLIVADERVANVEVSARGGFAAVIVHRIDGKPDTLAQGRFYTTFERATFADAVEAAALNLGIVERLWDGTVAITIRT